MIEDGKTGFLCENTEESWYNRLTQMIDDKQARVNVGAEAYEYVMKHCTTEAASKRLKTIRKAELVNERNKR